MNIEIRTCRVCQARWKMYGWFNHQPDRDYTLCEPCNAASLKSLQQAPAEVEAQRQRRIAHFGNDGTDGG